MIKKHRIQKNLILNIFVIGILFIVPFIFIAKSKLHQNPSQSWSQAAPTNVIKGYATADDGDSLHIKGHRVRLVGIDAPELKQVCHHKKQNIACGMKAKLFVEDLIKNKQIACRWLDKDKYNRILGHCYIGNEDLNRKIVANGWALNYSFPSNGDNNYKQEEKEARQTKRGIWQWEFENPKTWRKANPRN